MAITGHIMKNFLGKMAFALALVMPFACHAKDTVTLAFTGDIMMGTNYPDSSYLVAHGGKNLFRDVSPVIRQADAAFGNLEGVLMDAGGEVKKCNNPAVCYAFRTPVSYVRNLVDAGFDAVSIANNHANDFGLIGRLSTMSTLRKAGIAYAGQEGYCETAVFQKNGITYGFAAFGHSIGTLRIQDIAKARQIIQSLHDKADLIVVSFHGGAEGMGTDHVPGKQEIFLGEDRGNVKAFARACIEAGADIVYGHGPHLPRAIELYKGHLIAYSLGNFCTPQRVRLAGQLAYAPVLEATVNLTDGTFVKGKIHSFIQFKGIGPRREVTHTVAGRIRALTLSDFPDTNLIILPDGRIERKNKAADATELHHKHSLPSLQSEETHPVSQKPVGLWDQIVAFFKELFGISDTQIA